MRGRHLHRNLVAIGCLLAILFGSLAIAAKASQNQQGPTAGEQLIGACRATGGVADVWVERTGAGWQFTVITCRGGSLDGLQCSEFPAQSPWCKWSLTRPIEQLEVTPEGGIEVVEREPITALPPVTNGGARPTVAEDPADGNTVAENQIGHPIDNALAQANICRALGGDAHFGEDWGDPGDGWVVVRCTGGLLDGLWCNNDSRAGTTCQILALLARVEEVVVTPEAGVEQPSRSSDPVQTEMPIAPTIAPTEIPPAPTVTPTETPSEPTVAPTQAPPPPPRNDSAMPPSEAEDPTAPAPPPTPVVLT